MWILNQLGLENSHVLPLYLGDDVSDEDAFAALSKRPNGGIGIKVQDPSDDNPCSETSASYLLRNTQEVQNFLKILCQFSDVSVASSPGRDVQNNRSKPHCETQSTGNSIAIDSVG